MRTKAMITIMAYTILLLGLNSCESEMIENTETANLERFKAHFPEQSHQLNFNTKQQGYLTGIDAETEIAYIAIAIQNDHGIAGYYFDIEGKAHYIDLVSVKDHVVY